MAEVPYLRCFHGFGPPDWIAAVVALAAVTPRPAR